MESTSKNKRTLCSEDRIRPSALSRCLLQKTGTAILQTTEGITNNAL